MSLSRPLYSFLGFYFEQLFNHPIRTKCITSACIATSASYTSQKLAGSKQIDQDGLLAYGLFGLLFGGTLPHYFYEFSSRILPESSRVRNIMQFILERVAFAPFYQAISLYFLSRFEGKTHDTALAHMYKLYWPILQANWKYLSLFVFFNVTFAPPMLRPLIMNIIGFFWVVFVGIKRKKAAAKITAGEKSKSS